MSQDVRGPRAAGPAEHVNRRASPVLTREHVSPMPRILKDPVGCRASILSQTSRATSGQPASEAVSAALRISGVRTCSGFCRSRGEHGSERGAHATAAGAQRRAGRAQLPLLRRAPTVTLRWRRRKKQSSEKERQRERREEPEPNWPTPQRRSRCALWRQTGRSGSHAGTVASQRTLQQRGRSQAERKGPRGCDPRPSHFPVLPRLAVGARPSTKAPLHSCTHRHGERREW